MCYNMIMIENLKETNLYKSLNLNKNLHHAYLFTSLDRELNNQVALSFAKSIICEHKTACDNCNSCKLFNNNCHPDYYKIDQTSIKVEDVNKLMSQLQTKPFSASHKVFVILNAENINEISQNKLLKSLEEPNQYNIFILSTNKLDKLLPTVLSRLHKVNIPKISNNDLMFLANELKKEEIDVEKYFNSNFNLTEIINFETNENYLKTTNAIKYIFENLRSSQDIPKVASSLPEFDKSLFFPILQKILLSCINNQTFFDENLISLIKTNYPQKSLINILQHIEDSYKKQMSNVNLGYIIDNLLFNILKEKFLCKQ